MKFSATGTSSKSGGSKKKSNQRRRSGGSSTRRARKIPIGLMVFLIIMALLVGGGAGGYWVFNRDISGNRGLDATEIVVTLPEGASTADAARILKENKVILYPDAFRTYCRLFGADGTFQLGSHVVRADMSYDEIIESLQQTTHRLTQTFTVTFPEGTTCLKMALILQEAGACTVEEFLAACNEVYDVSFYDLISDSPLKFVKLEGFLYPDTYEFEAGATPHDIIQEMLENFERKVCTPEMMADIESSMFTFEEAIIFGSIVQKESYGGVEYRVSGVFHNRMAPNSGFDRLESCTTDSFRWGVLWFYYNNMAAVPSQRPAACPAEMDAAYDTYKYSGLPIGAICNPSVGMIDAGLHPEDTPYYFFCSNTETKEYYWAVTDAEHEANKRLAGLA